MRQLGFHVLIVPMRSSHCPLVRVIAPPSRGVMGVIGVLGLIGCGLVESDPPTGAQSAAGDDAGNASGGAGTGEYPASLLEACHLYKNARCGRVEECSGRISHNDCSPLVECPDVLFSDGSTWTIEETVRCAEEWRDWSCAALNEFEAPPCEDRPGTRQEGESCLFESQCEHYCEYAGSGCRVCSGSGPPQPNCGDVYCHPLLGECTGDSTREEFWACGPRVPDPEALAAGQAEGEPCDGFFSGGPLYCMPPLVCMSQDGGAGVCKIWPPETAVGDACWIEGETGRDVRGCGAGLGCRVQDDTCQPLPGEGEACMMTVNFVNARVCGAGLHCVASQELCEIGETSCPDPGVCTRPGGPGASCLFSLNSGAGCAAGEFCVDEICIAEIALREADCDAEFTRCAPNSRCIENVCMPDDTLRLFGEICE